LKIQNILMIKGWNLFSMNTIQEVEIYEDSQMRPEKRSSNG